MAGQFSEAIQKYGREPVYVKGAGGVDQVSAFARQIVGLIDDAHKYALSFTTPAFDQTRMSEQVKQLKAIQQSWDGKAVRDDQILSLLQSINSLLGTIKILSSPSSSMVATFSRPFPLWNVGMIYEKCPARVRLNLTGGFIDDDNIRAFREITLANGNKQWQELRCIFIDPNTISAQGVRGQRVMFMRNTPAVVPYAWNTIGELNAQIRRLFLIALEAGWMLARTSQQSVIGNGDAITKIEYRDRIVEVEKEVVKEVRVEVPGPERIVEKVITVPGPERIVEKPASVGVIYNSGRKWSDIKDGEQVLVMEMNKDGTIIEYVKLMEKAGDSVVEPNPKTNLWVQQDSAKVLPGIDNRYIDDPSKRAVYQMVMQGIAIDTGTRYRVANNVRIAEVLSMHRHSLQKELDQANTQTPQPQPQPNQPSSSGNEMSLAYKQLIIQEDMGINRTASNDGRPMAWEGNLATRFRNTDQWGQGYGASVVMGGRPRLDPVPASWMYSAYETNTAGQTVRNRTQAIAAYERDSYRWMDIIEPWGVFAELVGSQGSHGQLRADARNMRTYILRTGSSTWELLDNDPTPVQWNNFFLSDMSTHGQNSDPENNKTTAIVPVTRDVGRVAHWGARRISNPDISGMEGLLIMVEARINPTSPQGAKIGLQLGCDYKLNNSNNNPPPGWYPGAGLTRINVLTREWQRFAFVNIRGVQDGTDPRTITVERFLQTKVPLPDDQYSRTGAVVNPPKQSETDNSWSNNNPPVIPSNAWNAKPASVNVTIYKAAADSEQTE